MVPSNRHKNSYEFISCNGLGASPLKLLLAYSRSFFKIPQFVQSEKREIIYTYQGRNAIALLCKILKLGSKDEVLAPAYNCGAEIDPFIRAGAKVVLYDIDSALNIDEEAIKRMVTNTTRVIYVTHFFGWPQNVEGLSLWCKEKGILLIEDCAQALYSMGPDNTIGRMGDAAIYSFVKSLPSPEGGALVIDKKQWDGKTHFSRPPLKNTLRASVPLFKKWFMNSIGFWQRYEITRSIFMNSWRKNAEKKRDEPRPAMLKSNYFIERQADWTMSRFAQGLVQSVDSTDVFDKRRRNYIHLHRALQKIPGFKPVFEDLPDGVCPMAYPFMVKERHRWHAELDACGILVQGWPGYYPGFNWDDYPQSCNLKDNLLTLPVHQYLDLRQMEYIAACVKEIAAKAEP